MKARVLSAVTALMLALTMASCGSVSDSLDRNFGTITQENVGEKIVYAVHCVKTDFKPDYQPCTDKKLSGMKLLELVSFAVGSKEFLDAKGMMTYTDASLLYDSEQEITDNVFSSKADLKEIDIKLYATAEAGELTDKMNEKLSEAVHRTKGENAQVPVIEDAWAFSTDDMPNGFIVKVNGEWKVITELEDDFTEIQVQ